MKLSDISALQILSSRKLVNSRLMNFAGVQVMRTLAARSVYSCRRTPKTNQDMAVRKSLDDEGVVIIENFLSASEFDAAQKVALSLMERGDSRIQSKMHGPTKYEFASFAEFENELSQLKCFFDDSRLTELLQYAERKHLDFSQSHRGIERVTQGLESCAGDPETVLHSDTFYNTFKAWLYLTDVRPEDAPLVFVRRSHLLSMKQLREIYRHSCNPNERSRRIREEELNKLGLREEVFACKKNTLVLANVCAYHRRSIGQPGGQRVALHCSIRTQPFIQFRS